MKYFQEFETHLTIELDQLSEIEKLKRWGEERGFKFLHILLDKGTTPSQPMLTWHGQGEFSCQLKKAENEKHSLVSDGFSVVRVKIEAAPGNKDVPSSDAEARLHPPDRYFEHHLKLLLQPELDLLPLKSLVQKHGAHLSRNILHHHDDRQSERFITQRCKGIGQNSARQRLQILSNELKYYGYYPINTIEEFVVYDSNITIDAGWINSME